MKNIVVLIFALFGMTAHAQYVRYFFTNSMFTLLPYSTGTNVFIGNTNGSAGQMLTLRGPTSAEWSNAISNSFVQNTNYVIVAPYDTALSAAGNFGPTTGQTSAEWLAMGHIYRVRQTGNITQAKFYIASTTGITGLFVKVWRKVGSTYNLVSTSEDLSSGLTGSALNTKTLVTPIAAVEGDYIGIRVTYSSASVQNFTARTGITAVTNYSVLNSAPSGTAFDWEAQTADAGAAIPFEIYMTAPMFVTIGDSLVSGSVSNHSFADNVGASVSDPPVAMAWGVGHATGYSYQNMGIGGNTASAVDVRFVSDAAALCPKFVVIDGGVNDILGGHLNSEIITRYISMLTVCQNSNIVPVVMGIVPFRNYGSATTPMLQQRDLLNISLRSLVSSYGGFYVDPDPIFGKTYPGGDAGNLWTLQGIYDSGDGIHLNSLGYSVWSSAVIDSIASLNVVGGIYASSIQSHGNILIDGTAAKQISMQRNTQPDNDGFALNVLAGGVSQGATNRNGGALNLSPGTSTGTGKSQVTISIPDVGSTGSADNTPTPMLTLYRNATGTAYSKLQSSNQDALHTFYDGTTYEGAVGYSFLLGQIGLYSSADASSPAIGVTPSKYVSIGSGDTPLAKLHVFSTIGSTTNQNDATVRFSQQDGDHYLWMGVNTNSTGWGLIGAINAGVAHESININPYGGMLGIGLSVTSPSAFIHAYTNGPMELRLESSGANSFVRFWDAGAYKGGFGYESSSGNIGIVTTTDGAAPQAFVDTANNFHIGQADAGTAKFNINAIGGTNYNTSAIAHFYVDSQNGIWFNYTNNVGYIGAVHEGVAHEPLSLNPYGGGVIISNLTMLGTLTASNATVGTSGQVLTSGGAGNPPSWTTRAASGVSLDAVTADAASSSIGNGAFTNQWFYTDPGAGKASFTIKGTNSTASTTLNLAGQMTSATAAFVKINETTASTSGANAQYLLDVETLASSTANPLRVATRGTEVFRVDQTNPQILAASGTTTVPTYSFSALTTGGMLYNPTKIQLQYDANNFIQIGSSSYSLKMNNVVSGGWSAAQGSTLSNGAGTTTLDAGGSTLSGVEYISKYASDTADVTLLSFVDGSTTVGPKTIHDNFGSSGTVIYTLPAASSAGREFTFIVAANHILEILAVGSDQIQMNASLSAAAGNIQSTTVGNTVTLVSGANNRWYVTSYVGTVAVTWTVN